VFGVADEGVFSLCTSGLVFQKKQLGLHGEHVSLYEQVETSAFWASFGLILVNNLLLPYNNAGRK